MYLFKVNVLISITISYKYVANGPINNIPAVIQIRRQAVIWTNVGYITDAYMHYSTPMC